MTTGNFPGRPGIPFSRATESAATMLRAAAPLGSESDAVPLYRGLDAPEYVLSHHVEADLIRLREAEAEELWAVLSLDLCQARAAAAKVKAIKARLVADDRSHEEGI